MSTRDKTRKGIYEDDLEEIKQFSLICKAVANRRKIRFTLKLF